MTVEELVLTTGVKSVKVLGGSVGVETGDVLGTHAVVLFKVRQPLRLAFLDNGEVGGREAGDGLAVAAGDDDIEQDFAGGDGKRGAGPGWSLQRQGGILRGGLCLGGKRDEGDGEEVEDDGRP